MEAKHTATPWKTPCGITIMAGGRRIAVLDNVYVSQKEAGNYEGDQREANAEFIVRACNSHQDLIAVCQRVLTHFENIRGDKEDTGMMAQLRAVLAKAST